MTFGLSPFSTVGYSAPATSSGTGGHLFAGTSATSYGAFGAAVVQVFTGAKTTIAGGFVGSTAFVPRPVVGYIDSECNTQYGEFVSPLSFSFKGVKHAKAGIFQGILNRQSGTFAGANLTQAGVFSSVTTGFFAGVRETQYGAFVGTRPTVGTFAGIKATKPGVFDGPPRDYPSSLAMFVTTRQPHINVIG